MSTKISQLTSATDVTANDLIQIVDVEDGVMAPSGTNKKATASLLAKELAKQPLEPGVVISGSSSSDAVRITQTGSGNALVVEDSSNPDSSPLVVNQHGSLQVGFNQFLDISGYNGFEGLQLANSGASTSSAAITMSRWSADNGGAVMTIGKSRGIGVGNRAIVQNGDILGAINFAGDDGGTGDFPVGARILAAADGTTGVNDLPSRLQFFTTSDNSSTPVEAMRITSAGNVGIGATPPAGRKLDVRGTATGASDASHVFSGATIASDITSEFKSFASLPSTAASSFTLNTLDHYRAGQGTFGSGSLVNSQSGFKVGNSLIGANVNYGFFSEINNTNSTVSNVSLTSNVVTLTTSGNHGFAVNQRILVASSVTAVNGTYTITSVPSPTTLTYAKTNADIASTVATGTIKSSGRWNFYGGGSAPNHFSGDVRVGTTNSGARISVVSGVTSTDDAVRITQAGSGQALVVEDSINPDLTKFVVSGNGDVGIGVNVPLAKLEVVESDVTSAIPTVRITNTGTADSLIVEDSANPDATPLVINNGGSVAIGTTTVNGSCLLQMTSTTKGFRPPSMTTTQRNAIATPLAGVMIYNNTTNKLNFYNGTAWEQVTSAI